MYIRFNAVIAVITFFLAAVFLSDAVAEEVADIRQKGIESLKASQTNPRAIVAAARHFAKAAAVYEAQGLSEQAVEMNSFLYWCKKKMNVDDIEAFTKAGEISLTERLIAVENEKVPATDAQSRFDLVETFARTHPEEQLLIAVRFFEIADRFKGTDISFTALDRSLKALQSAGAEKSTLPPVNLSSNREKEKSGAQAVPETAKLKEAEKAIKDLFKEEYGKIKPTEKLALAQKLLQQGNETLNDLPGKYVQLREARDLASQAGDIGTALKAADAISSSFAVSGLDECIAALQKTSESAKSKEQALPVAEAALLSVETAISSEEYEKLRPLIVIVEQAGARALDPKLSVRIKTKVAQANELQRGGAAAKAALEKLKTNADDPISNLVVGKFYCLVKEDWERGLPALARGSDPILKTAAEKDIAPTTDANVLVSIGDSWWSYAEKLDGPTKQRVQARASFWYSKAMPQLAGLEKAKVEKRLALATDKSPVNTGAKSGAVTTSPGTIKPQDWYNLVDISGCQQMEDYLRINKEQILSTKESFNGPLEVTAIVRTDSTNLMFKAYKWGCLSFNPEDLPGKAKVWSPDVRREMLSTPSFVLSVNEWHKIVWRITTSGTEVIVDNRVIHSDKKTFLLNAKDTLRIFGENNSVVDVKSLSIKAPQK